MTPVLSTAVDNGARLAVAFPFFTGIAGVRLFDDGGEFSCFGDVPYPATNIAGQVGGRPAQAVAVRASTVAAKMIVARFRYLEGDAA